VNTAEEIAERFIYKYEQLVDIIDIDSDNFAGWN